MSDPNWLKVFNKIMDTCGMLAIILAILFFGFYLLIYVLVLGGM